MPKDACTKEGPPGPSSSADAPEPYGGGAEDAGAELEAFIHQPSWQLVDGLWIRQLLPGSPKELGAASDVSSFSGTSFAPDCRFGHQSSQSSLATDYEDVWNAGSSEEEELPTENYNEENSEQHPRFSFLRKSDFCCCSSYL